MIKLGSRVRDTITGHVGITTGRTEWTYGCTRYCVEAERLTDDGKAIEPWFDEQRLETVEEKEPEVSAESIAPIGGPRDNPPRQADPVR